MKYFQLYFPSLFSTDLCEVFLNGFSTSVTSLNPDMLEHSSMNKCLLTSWRIYPETTSTIAQDQVIRLDVDTQMAMLIWPSDIITYLNQISMKMNCNWLSIWEFASHSVVEWRCWTVFCILFLYLLSSKPNLENKLLRNVNSVLLLTWRDNMILCRIRHTCDFVSRIDVTTKWKKVFL